MWRGLTIDRETVRLIRRVIELSGELRSITALSRSMYLSRRALGRRFMTRGLPVPSHWLQLGRLLRVASRLQNSEASLFSIACDSGYPDGFSVSNQMHRLIGCRPSLARERLGWEWIVEAWLRKEADEGVSRHPPPYEELRLPMHARGSDIRQTGGHRLGWPRPRDVRMSTTSPTASSGEPIRVTLFGGPRITRADTPLRPLPHAACDGDDRADGDGRDAILARVDSLAGRALSAHSAEGPTAPSPNRSKTGPRRHRRGRGPATGRPDDQE